MRGDGREKAKVRNERNERNERHAQYARHARARASARERRSCSRDAATRKLANSRRRPFTRYRDDTLTSVACVRATAAAG